MIKLLEYNRDSKESIIRSELKILAMKIKHGISMDEAFKYFNYNIYKEASDAVILNYALEIARKLDK